MSFTVNGLIDQFRARKLDPRQVVQDIYQKIDSTNNMINAFVTLNKCEATAQAEESHIRWQNGEPRPLEGVPLAIKDLTPTKGLRTTRGSGLFEDHVPDRDALVVERLRNAGAIIIGKTNTPEFGWKATTDNLLFGATKSPSNTNYAAGGSSGGSAAAVAAGFVPAAEGSDGGGSIRIPASLCGVVGFKPSYGRIPNNNPDGVFGTHEPFIHEGVLTATVEDALLLTNVMQGFSTHDPFSVPVESMKFLDEKKTREMVIGVTEDFGIYDLEPAVGDHFNRAVDILKDEGWTVVHLDFEMKKDIRGYIEYFESLWTAGLAAGLSKASERNPEMFSEGLKAMIKRGQALSAVEFKQLENYRAYLWQHFQSFFKQCDIILSPTLATAGFPADQEGPRKINGREIKEDADWVMTQIYNLTGLPAISLPAGSTNDGGNTGIQLAANRLQDEVLLSVSRQIEKLLKKK